MPKTQTADKAVLTFSLMEVFRQIEEKRIETLRKPLYTTQECFIFSKMSPEEKQAFHLAYDQACETESESEREALLAPFQRFVGDVPETVDGVQHWTESWAHHALDNVSYIDAYGSGVYHLKLPHQAGLPKQAQKSFIVLETYGDEDSTRHDDHMLIYTPCVLYTDEPGGRIIGGEIADLVLTPENQVEIKNHYMLAEALPGWLSKAFVDGGIGGKRALYFNPEEKRISVRCSEEVYVKAKAYQDPERPVGNPNLSGTRLLIPFVPVTSGL